MPMTTLASPLVAPSGEWQKKDASRRVLRSILLQIWQLRRLLLQVVRALQPPTVLKRALAASSSSNLDLDAQIVIFIRSTERPRRDPLACTCPDQTDPIRPRPVSTRPNSTRQWPDPTRASSCGPIWPDPRSTSGVTTNCGPPCKLFVKGPLTGSENFYSPRSGAAHENKRINVYLDRLLRRQYG